MTALFGIKIGMTRIFDESGNMVPVTVIKADPHCIIRVKLRETDGYNALQAESRC